MPTQLPIEGRWRLRVLPRDLIPWRQDSERRFTITGSENADGTYPAVSGPSLEVIGSGQQSWTITVEHNDGSGWMPSEVRASAPELYGAGIAFNIETEDEPGAQPEDAFEDLTVRAGKVGMFEVPFRPYALKPDTLQMTPDGIFEASFGAYFMAVRVQNIWTQALPEGLLLGISSFGRALLAQGGIEVDDDWTTSELEMLGQEVSGTRVVLGPLAPWEMRTIFFKIDCSSALPAKHVVEFELVNAGMPDPQHPNRRTGQTIFVTRTAFNPVTKEFVCECDRGRLYMRLRELAAEYTTLVEAVQCARQDRAAHGDPLEYHARRILDDLLKGNAVDVCEVKRVLDCMCPERPSSGRRPACEGILMFPTKFDYRVELNEPYTGQFGPIPFDDPWWKALLMLIGIVAAAAAAGSASAELAYSSDDIVIGTLFDSKLEPESDGRYLVDAALCRLNRRRPVSLPSRVLDAQPDETFTVPVVGLGGRINLTGRTLTNLDIDDLIAAYITNPTDPTAIAGVRVYKSGARTGTTHALMTRVEAVSVDLLDGSTRPFKEQVRFDWIPAPAPGAPPNPIAMQPTGRVGDSGSLLIHWATGDIVALVHAAAANASSAYGARIQDVMAKMNIVFRREDLP